MRCAHCGQRMKLRWWFQFRLDGGYRCSSCRHISYIEDVVVRNSQQPIMSITAISVLLVLVSLRLTGLMDVRIMLLIMYSLLLPITAVYRFALRDAPTVTTLPAYIIRRRLLINIGVTVVFVTQLGGLAARELGFVGGPSLIVQLFGSLIAVVCFVLGIMQRWKRTPDLFEN